MPGFGKLGARGGFGSMGVLGKPGTSGSVTVPDLTNYQSGPWTLFLNPFNKVSLGVSGSDSATVFPATFPVGTIITSTWPTRTPGAPIGFNQICYGDYFNTVPPAPITAQQISKITTLATTFNLPSSGTANGYVTILDWFLTDAANAHTAGHHKCEIEVALNAPSYFQGYIAAIGGGISGAQLGTVTISGIQFTVARDDTANSGAYPDYLFMPTDLADHSNVSNFDINSLHAWLIAKTAGTANVVSGAWYFNGLAFGYEPQQGTATLTASALSVNYVSTALAFPQLNQGLQARAFGVRNAKIIFDGNSTTAGVGATSNATLLNGARHNITRKILPYFPWGSDSSFFADHNTTIGGGAPTLASLDPRITLGSWVQNVAGTMTLGGPMVSATSGASPFIFAPEDNVDTFEVVTRRFAGLGTFNINIDGGANTLIDQTVSAGTLQTTTITTGTAGLHKLNLTWASGAVDFVRISAYNSAQKQTSIMNAGWSGSKIADKVASSSNAYDPANVLAFEKPDLIVMAGPINDWVAATTIGTFNANWQTWITAAKATGADVLMIIEPPSQTTSASAAQQLIYANAMRTLAASNSIPIYDLATTFTDWATANAAGLTYDSLHYNAKGYDKWSDAVISQLGIVKTDFSAAAQAIFSAFTTPPTNKRKAQISYSIDLWQSLGAWSLIDAMWCEGAADSQAATINWINPGTFTLVPTNSPTFTADRGFQGNGVNSYCSTGFNPTTSGVNFKQNDAALWVFNCTAAAQTSASGADMGNNSVTPLALVVSRNSVNNTSFRMNDATGTNGSSTTSDGSGLYGFQRISSTVKAAWKNTASLPLTSPTVTSTGLPNQVFYLGAVNSGGIGSSQLAMGAVTASFSGKELTFANAALAYARNILATTTV